MGPALPADPTRLVYVWVSRANHLEITSYPHSGPKRRNSARRSVFGFRHTKIPTFCQSALAKVDDSKLDEKLPFFGERQLSRAEVMFATAQDWADHYSQLANYLRLNGLLPPTAKGKEE